MRWIDALITAVVCLCGQLQASPAEGQFTDVTDAAGVAVTGDRQGGACFADVDQDGDYDVYVPREAGSALLVNDGLGVFEDQTATAIEGLTGRVAERGCAFGDINNDGLIDLVRTGGSVLEVYLNRGVSGGLVSFGNESHGPTFFIDENDGVGDPFNVNFEGLGILDYDADGFLDLAVQNEGGVRILENDGTGSFIVAIAGGLPAGPGQGDFLTVADIDVDGDVDVLARLPSDGDIFLNDGDGTFSEIPPNLAADDVNKGGILVCDFDNDGEFDLFFGDGVEDSLVNRVLLQDAGSFSATSVPNLAGAEVESAACGDVDHDGDLDLVVNLVESTRLYVNQLVQTGSFDLTRDDRGLTRVETARGVTLTDIDGDGDLDVFAAGTGPQIGSSDDFEAGSNALFRNEVDNVDYLLVRPLAEVSGCPAGTILREDLGAVVQLLDEGGALLAMREISGGADRGRMEAPVAHFGLPSGAAATYQVRVRFMYGGSDFTVPVTPESLGSPQQLDVVSSDPDNDTIPTEIEMADAAAAPDLDGDGVPAWLDVDADGDGMPDALEAGDADPCTPPADADLNGIPDYLEPMAPGDAGVPLDAGGPPDSGVPGDASSPGPTADAGAAGIGPLDSGAPPITPPGVELKGGGVAGCSAAASFPTVGWALALALSALLWQRRRNRRVSFS